MKAIELTGRIDEEHRLLLDTPLPETTSPGRVRVLILLEEEEINEAEWLKGAAANPAFDFLYDPEENIYSLSDGKPLNDET